MVKSQHALPAGNADYSWYTLPLLLGPKVLQLPCMYASCVRVMVNSIRIPLTTTDNGLTSEVLGPEIPLCIDLQRVPPARIPRS